MNCIQCNKELTAYQKSKGQKYCSLACYWEAKRGTNPNRHIQVRQPQGGLAYLHRMVYEKAHGKIPYGVVIHHLDGNKHNNALSNLQAMSLTEHTALHNTLESDYDYSGGDF